VPPPAAVAFCGTGLGAVAARGVAGLVAPWSPVPIIDPAGVRPARTLVVDLGGGGDPTAFVVPGGPDGHADRLGLAARVVGGLAVVARAVDRPVPDAASLADRLADRIAEMAPAVDGLVRRIGRRLPLVHGGGPVGAALADYWKFQVNRHGKVACWAASTPQLAHDEVCSWGQHGDVTRQVFHAVMLRGAHEDPVDAAQLDRYEALLDEFVAGLDVVRSTGPGPLDAVVELAVWGEQLGLALALHEGFDPAPAPGLEWRV